MGVSLDCPRPSLLPLQRAWLSLAAPSAPGASPAPSLSLIRLTVACHSLSVPHLAMCRAAVTNSSEQTFKLAYNVLFNGLLPLRRRVLPLPIFQLARGEEVRQGSEDADAAPSTGGQREEPPLGSFSQSWAFVGKAPRRWYRSTPINAP